MEPTPISDSTALQVSAGESKLLQIQGNPTTGYSWSLQVSEDAKITCEKPEGEYQSPNTGLMGASGHYHFHVKVNDDAEVGSNHVAKLVYKRPWEQEAGQEVEVTFVVV